MRIVEKGQTKLYEMKQAKREDGYLDEVKEKDKGYIKIHRRTLKECSETRKGICRKEQQMDMWKL